MTKQTIAAAFISLATLIAASPAKASLILYASASTSEFQSTDSYDFSGPGNLPPATYQNIGTFTFAPIVDTNVSSITISGSFGNFDYNSTTALSDYYLGDATDGEEVLKVAACDSAALNCYSGDQGPYDWTLTLNTAQIADLATGLQNGSIDFGYTWDQTTPPVSDPFFGDTNGYDPQFIEAGPASLNIYTSPEPATFLFSFSGIAGILLLRRFRKV